MRKFALVMFATLVLGLSMLSGCSSSPYAKFGFNTMEKDGRLYVFSGMNSAEYQAFKREGDMVKRVTRPGAGPNGITIVAPDGDTIDRYLAAK